MQETFASYVEALERAGVSGLRHLPVPIVTYQGEHHLRRNTGIRLCDWRTGGDQTTLTVDELTRNEHLCAGCLPGALGKWITLHDLSSAGILGLARMVLDSVEESERVTAQLGRGRSVASNRVYGEIHGLRRLRDEAQQTGRWPGAPVHVLEDLAEQASRSLAALKAAASSETAKELVLAKVIRGEERLKQGPTYRVEDDDAEHLVSYHGDITDSLTLLPMLATEVITAYQLREEKGVTALVAPGRVVNYLQRVGNRARDWRLSSLTVNHLPDDPVVRETALGLWDPTQTGGLGTFTRAVEAAELV